MIKISAPAKINLTLEVLGKRPDGYHEISSIIQAVNLRDTLLLEKAQGITIEDGIPGLAAEDNLVFKAALMLKEFSGSKDGVNFKLIKAIPEAAGLGGGSSDAAAALVGLNTLWQLGLSMEELSPLAAKLGSDVPFFLRGGVALATGRGEIVTPLRSRMRAWVLMVYPVLAALPGKTGKLYSSLKPISFTRGEFAARVSEKLRLGCIPDRAILYNVFETVAFDVFKSLSDYRDRFLAAGAEWVHLAGSGPTLYTIIYEEKEARVLEDKIARQGLKSFLAETL